MSGYSFSRLIEDQRLMDKEEFMAKTATAKPTAQSRPLLYLNLRPFFIGGLFIILFLSPLLRGLFFQPELLQVHMLTALVFALAWYDQALRREISLPRRPLDYAVLALIAAYALSLFTAVHMRTAVGELMKVASYFMVYWVVKQTVCKERDLDRLLIVGYAAAFVVAVIGLAAAAGYFHFPEAFSDGMILSTMQYKNALAIYLVVMSLIGLGLSVKSDKPLPKILYALGNVLMFVAILGSQSRGGWLLYPLGLAALLAGLPRAYRWRAAYHLVIFLSCGLVAARLFLPRVQAGNGYQAAICLLVLAAAAVVMQYGYHRLGLWLGGEQVEDRTRRMVALGGFAYMVLVAAFYLFYSSAAMPSVLASVLPDKVAHRVETIATGSTTMPERLEMYRDAMRMAADYPLTGAGGGAWNALYHQYQTGLYWSTEAHNYFAQTLVEAGVLGLLAVLAIWGCFACLVFRLWRKTGREGGAWMSLWTVAVAAFTLGLHSFFDFDLSIPALAILLWAFFGIVRAGENLLEENNKRQPVMRESPPGARLALIALVATACSAALFLPAANLYAAGRSGAMGAQAINNKDVETAERYYLDAHRRDPYTASYAGDLAQVVAVKAIKQSDESAYLAALNYAREATTAEPYNAPVRAAMVSLYLTLNEIDLSVQESEALLKTNPLLPSNYEILGRTSISAARYYLEQGNAAGAVPYIEKTLSLPGLMKAKNDEMKAGTRRNLKEDPLPLTPAVALTAGQARYLAGQYEEARQVLLPLLSDKKVGMEAQLWLAATLTRQGQERQAAELLKILAAQGVNYETLYQELLDLTISGRS